VGNNWVCLASSQRLAEDDWHLGQCRLRVDITYPWGALVKLAEVGGFSQKADMTGWISSDIGCECLGGVV
jgi:hypothetical protein